VNTNFLSLLIRLDEEIKLWSPDYEANALSTRPRDSIWNIRLSSYSRWMGLPSYYDGAFLLRLKLLIAG